MINVIIMLDFRLRVRKRKNSGKHSSSLGGLTGHTGAMSTSLSSPISILASPAGGLNGAGLLHSSGPLSAPATFSWGAQSPIPPRGSPIVVVPTPITSPYLLSPGRDQYPPMAVGSCGTDPVLTSSPLMPIPVSVARGSPHLPSLQPPSSLSR